MLVLAGAVWWKTRPAENTNTMPPTTSSDSRIGIATVGMEGSRPTEASFPANQTTDGGGDHKLPVNSGSGQDSNSKTPVSPTPAQVDLEETPNQPMLPKPPVVATVLEYTVVPGDTLYGIVQRAYGTATEGLIDAVAAANGMVDPSTLDLGQVLRLPTIEGFSAPLKP